MKQTLRIFALIALFAIWGSGVCVASNQTATFYSKVNATATPTGSGKVYVSPNTEATSDIQYKETGTATCSKEEEGTKSAAPTQGTHTYYLYAQSEAGYVFNKWTKEGKDFEGNGANPCKVTVTVKSTSSGTPDEFGYEAHFIEKPALVAMSNVTGTETVVSPAINNVGDKVRLKASVQRITIQSGSIIVPNSNVRFYNWTDEDGNIVSTEAEFDYTIDREQTLTANFITLNELPKNGRYYRIYHILGRYLKLEGKYSVSIGGGTQVDSDLLRWVLSKDYPRSDYTITGIAEGGIFPGSDDGAFDENDVKYNAAGYSGSLGMDVYSDPGTIFYIEGTDGTTTMTKSTLASQGVKTTDVIKNQFLDIKPCDAGKFPGYHYMTSSSTSVAGIKANTPWDDKNPMHSAQAALRVYVGNGSATDYLCAVAFEPVDEAHVDYHYFGATASEAMEFDGGYWVSMYTAFPYRCYEEDGVEAYYVKEAYRRSDGTSCVALCKIEGGTVPAGEGVLLRCAEAGSSRTSRLIPLAPDTEIEPLEGNLLKGVSQLYTSKGSGGRVNFDESTMRVFGVSQSGEVGFYKLGGTDIELAANRAYLDLSAIPADRKAVSFKLSADDAGSSGIEEISGSGDAVNFEDSVIYDLNGIRVSAPQKGNIYIIDGKKVIW